VSQFLKGRGQAAAQGAQAGQRRQRPAGEQGAPQESRFEEIKDEDEAEGEAEAEDDIDHGADQPEGEAKKDK
jgi:hypothetical protein